MTTAVLLSGGLDSAVLLAEEAAGRETQPIYVSAGLSWEAAEREALSEFLAAWGGGGRVRPLASLSVDMTDVYPIAHWALQGRPPGYHTPDEDVYLPGRNIILLGKAGVYCAAARIGRLVIGTLDHNPFPDATPAFREAMASALSRGLDRRIDIDAPFAKVGKAEVVRRGYAMGVPLELTLSCMNPQKKDGNLLLFPRHCGQCSKCRERHDAFLEAGIADPTDYVDRWHVGNARS
jgi:7-cyano-7-deazaguanine synthase